MHDHEAARRYGFDRMAGKSCLGYVSQPHPDIVSTVESQQSSYSHAMAWLYTLGERMAAARPGFLHHGPHPHDHRIRFAPLTRGETMVGRGKGMDRPQL